MLKLKPLLQRWLDDTKAVLTDNKSGKCRNQLCCKYWKLSV